MKAIAIYKNGFKTPLQGSIFSAMICVEVNSPECGMICTEYFELHTKSRWWKPTYWILKQLHHKIINKFL